MLSQLHRRQAQFHAFRRGFYSRTPTSRSIGSLTFVATGLGILSYYFIYPDPSRAAPTSHDAPLSPYHFTPSTVVSSETCGYNTKLIRLKIPSHLIPDRSSSPLSPIWSVYIKDDDIQVERPYTPLEGLDAQGNMLFWIKKYPKGEVGRWLHDKQVGDLVELRGPLTTWAWQDENWDEVVMVSGGTGITPFYQLLHTVLFSGISSTRFTLLHASKSPGDLPPESVMAPLISFATSNPDRFKLQLFVDRVDGVTPPRMCLNQPLCIGRIDKSVLQGIVCPANAPSAWWSRLWPGSAQPPKFHKRILFLICGPEPMINAIAGPYGRNYSQGHVGGILGELGLTSAQVRKL